MTAVVKMPCLAACVFATGIKTNLEYIINTGVIIPNDTEFLCGLKLRKLLTNIPLYALR